MISNKKLCYSYWFLHFASILFLSSFHCEFYMLLMLALSVVIKNKKKKIQAWKATKHWISREAASILYLLHHQKCACVSGKFIDSSKRILINLIPLYYFFLLLFFSHIKKQTTRYLICFDQQWTYLISVYVYASERMTTCRFFKSCRLFKVISMQF